MTTVSQATLPELLGRTAVPEIAPLAAIVILGVAVLLSVPRVTWTWFGLFTTLVHELGHAFAAILSGRRLSAIKIRRDHSGSAETIGKRGFSAAFSGFFGYPTPAIVGAVLIWCVFNGFSATALLVGTVIIALTLLFIRNAMGVAVVVVSGLVSFALWWFASPQVQAYSLLVIGIVLLVGSVRGLFTVISVHTTRRSHVQSSDAYLLYKRTGIPSPVWLIGFTVVIALSLWWAIATVWSGLGG